MPRLLTTNHEGAAAAVVDTYYTHTIHILYTYSHTYSYTYYTHTHTHTTTTTTTLTINISLSLSHTRAGYTTPLESFSKSKLTHEYIKRKQENWRSKWPEIKYQYRKLVYYKD